MTSTFTAKADETTATILDTVTKLQDATLEAVTTFTANLPEAAKTAPVLPTFDLPNLDLPKVELPTAEEVTAAYFAFVEKFVANSKSFTERFIAAATPATAS